ncbi:hypothetical protein [Streptomyces sp. cg40]|uniref:hypothetical protein n=1 Tax=Streptomyces sp. cg40 TaxID=3419764 RepID=UPI003D043581
MGTPTELGEPLIEAVVRRTPRLLGGRLVQLYEEGFVRGARVRRWTDVTHWRSTVDVTFRRNAQHGIAWYASAESNKSSSSTTSNGSPRWGNSGRRCRALRHGGT